MKRIILIFFVIMVNQVFSQEQANMNRNWYDVYTTTIEKPNIPTTTGETHINCVDRKIIIYSSGCANLPPVKPGSYKNTDVDLYFKIDSEKRKRLYGILEMDLEDDGLLIYGTYIINKKKNQKRAIPRCGWFEFDEYVEFSSLDFTSILMNINKVEAKPGAKSGPREFKMTIRVSYNEM